MNYSLLDVPIHFQRSYIIETLKKAIINHRKGYICTINANIISEANRNENYRIILLNSFINICDGSLLSKGLSIIYKANLTSWPGPDFFIDLIKLKKFKSYFIGSDQSTLLGLKTYLKKLDPSVENMQFQPLPFAKVEDFKYHDIAILINQNDVDLIWVSLGAPKQEIFASRLMPLLNKGIIICVGAAFDFYSNQNGINRAPLVFRKLNLEWLWRLFNSPLKTAKRLSKEICDMPCILLKQWLINRSQK